jgi:arylsulfatase A-like enzyme
MNRLLTLLLLLCLGRASVAPVQAAAPRPNFVFIIADDLGWADVAFHGGRVPTPHLDRLAAQGVELVQHYVYPVCSPTRAALLSGRYATRFGVTTPQNARAFRWDQVTLAGTLKAAGYDTALCGKWHLGSRPEEGPQKFGFDRGYGSLAGGVGPWDHRYKTGQFSTTWHRDGQLIEEQGHVTDLIAREAVQWIESRTERPFFLYVPFTAVHLPIKEPAEWLAKVPASITGDVPRHYAACVMHLDDAVGRLVAALEKTGRYKDTLIVFTSDNGGSTAGNADPAYPADDYPTGKLPGNNQPLRNEKGSVYEGGIRVPTLAHWPRQLKPGKFNGVAHITDWMPTFCALAGWKPDRDLRWDGLDLWPQLTAATPPPPRALYIAAPRFEARIVRDGDWKLLTTAKRTELYHLAADPHETTDLAAKEPAKVEALRARLAALSLADRDAVADD